MFTRTHSALVQGAGVLAAVCLTFLPLAATALAGTQEGGLNCSKVQPVDGTTVTWSCRGDCCACKGSTTSDGYVVAGCKCFTAPYGTCTPAQPY